MSIDTTDPQYTAMMTLLQQCRVMECVSIDVNTHTGLPVPIWVVIGRVSPLDEHGEETDEYWEMAAGATPLLAAQRFASLLIDGKACTRCDRPTTFMAGDETIEILDSPFGSIVSYVSCVIAWDPELKVYRRGCAGDSEAP